MWRQQPGLRGSSRSRSMGQPVATALGLLLVALLFRLPDIFIYRLDERWGEIILSKAAGCLVLPGFL